MARKARIPKTFDPHPARARRAMIWRLESLGVAAVFGGLCLMLFPDHMAFIPIAVVLHEVLSWAAGLFRRSRLPILTHELLLMLVVGLAVYAGWIAAEVILGQTPPAGFTFIGGLAVLWLSLILMRLGRFYAANPEIARKFRGENPIVIYGAGTVAWQLLQDIARTGNVGNFRIAAIVDNNPEKIGGRLGAYRIRPGADLPSIAEEHSIREVWFTMPVSPAFMDRILSTMQGFPIRYKVVPRKMESLLPDIRSLGIEDLVQRPEIRLDSSELSQMFRNKRILVTGAAGSIGREIARQLSEYAPQRLVLGDQWEQGVFDLTTDMGNLEFVQPMVLDVRNATRLRQILRSEKPHFIFHCAAYKHVPLMELHFTEAIRTNILGTYNLLTAASEWLQTANTEELPRHRLEIVNISTDKAVQPENIMGHSKRLAELITYSMTQDFKEQHRDSRHSLRSVSVRFGNVLGSSGSVVPIFWSQIESGGPVTVTHPEMERFFMTIPEAVNLVLHALPVSKGRDILALDMGRSVRIAELAERLIVLAGKIPYKDIRIEYTGIRPGEKLREDVFWQNNSIPTRNPYIFRTESELIRLQVRKTISRIEGALRQERSLQWWKGFLTHLSGASESPETHSDSEGRPGMIRRTGRDHG